MNAGYAASSEKADTKASDWTRVAGWASVAVAVLTLLTAAFIGWWVQGIAQVSDVEELGGYVFHYFPFGIIGTIALSIIGGSRGGQGRRLAIIAGLLLVGTIPVCMIVSVVAPLRT